MTERYHPAPSLEALETQILQLGRGVAEEVIVAGSMATEAALPGAIADFPPGDIDVLASKGAYNYLRQQPAWSEAVASSHVGPWLRKDNLDLGLRWNEFSYEQLAERKWLTERGVQIAGPADTLASTQNRGSSKDMLRTKMVRDYLLNIDNPPIISPRVMHRELELARTCLTHDELRGDSVAEELIATSLFTDYVLYGHPESGFVNQIIGTLERPAYGVMAFYHNGYGLVEELVRLQDHFAYVNHADILAGRPVTFTPEDCLDAIIGHSGADTNFGDGRESHQPPDQPYGGHDEARSAALLATRAWRLGYPEVRAMRLYRIVDGTGFDESTGRQKGQNHPESGVRAVAGIDAQPTSEPNALVELGDLALEDGASERYNPERPIGNAMMAEGFRPRTRLEALTWIHEHAGEHPEALRGYTDRFAAGANFFDPDHPKAYIPPVGWTLENRAMRYEHASETRRIAQALQRGKMTILAAAVAQQTHAERMRERFPRSPVPPLRFK